MKKVLILVTMVAAGLLAARGGGRAAESDANAEVKPQIKHEVEIVRDVQFGLVGERKLLMHLVRPKGKAEEPRPVLVFLFGGGWRTGNRDIGLGLLNRYAQRGYFCASIDYRLSKEALFPAQIEDVKNAIRFLRAKAKDYQINPDRMGVWGMSSGGHLAALAGTSGDVTELEGQGGSPDQSSQVQAVVDWFGPTDFLQMDAAGSRINHNDRLSPESRLIGGPIQENKEKVARANPITYVSKDDPPFLIIHGSDDPVVPMQQSELLVAALRKAEVPVTFHVVPGAGHGFDPEVVVGVMDLFLDEHLKGIKPPQ